MKKGMLTRARFCLFFVFPFLGLGIGTAFSQSPEFATFSGGVTGTGTFDCDAMPNFTYSITGDFVPPSDPNSDTSVPGPNQVVDNNGAGFELIFGSADMAPNIEVEVAGYTGAVNDIISLEVVTELIFDTATPANEFAFLIADVEQDQVTVCATYPDGSAVPISVINSWYQNSFDADNSDNINAVPTWDNSTGTLVGQYNNTNGVKQTLYQEDLLDNEAGSAWFLVNVPIKSLALKSQALGIAPDDPSQHFIFASTCQCEEVAGVVFEDIDRDGCDNSGVGVQGVTVELFDCDAGGAAIASTVTGVNGEYTFGPNEVGAAMVCLIAGGSYNVVISDLPTGFVNTPGLGQGCPGAQDNAPANDGVSLCVDPSDTAAGAGETVPAADQHIDFGIALPCEEVAGVVFEDIDRDGCDNSGAGVPGVTVELFDCDTGGAAIATVVTGSDGSYTFGPDEVGASMVCLTPGGSYNVVISSLPGDYIYTPGPGLACVGDEDDSPANDGVSLCVDPSDTAAGGGETGPADDQHIDFGLALPCEEVAGVVFEDIDRDGCDNSGVGVPGVTVELFDCDASGAAIATMLTGADGSYTFGPDESGAAMVCLTPGGSYNVVVSNLPAGFINTPGPGTGCPGATDDAPANDGVSLCVDPSNTVAGGGEPGPAADQHIDFGIALPCEEVAGVVFEDIDRDGCDNSGVGVPGVTVELFDCDAGGAAIATMLTGADGSYTFGPNESGAAMVCLTPGGSYNVEISNLPAGFINTPGRGIGCPGAQDNAPANDGVSLCVDPSDTVAGAGETIPGADQHIDFGIALPCEEVAGVVFEDIDRDGCDNSGVGIEGVTVELFDCDAGGAAVASTMTGVNGEYTFGPDEVGSSMICLTPGGSYNVVISGLPGDYIYTPGPGLACPGDTDDAPANDGVSLCVDPSDTVAGVGEPGPMADQHIDFGLALPCEEVAGVVFEDIDRDGCDNSGVGIPGVTVELFDCNAGGAAIATMLTGADGSYAFGPNELGAAIACLTPGGSYNVEISNLPAGFINTPGPGTGCPGATDDAPANDGVSLCVDPSNTVAGGGEPGPAADQHIDFGIALPCEEVAGVVFEDIDRDGCDNSGAGVPGVTVELFDCDAGGAAIATMLTGADGSYTFGPNELGAAMVCLTPGGSYNVVISNIPAGFINTPGLGTGCPGAQDNAPANDGVSLCVDPSDTVAGAGETVPGADQHIDFGIALPCEEVAGVVFEDIDRDGCDNSGVGVQGVTVELFDCDAGGAAVASTVTGVNGEYTFGPDEVGSSMICLTPGGSYNVVISGLPGDYIYTPGPGLGCAGDTDDSPANDGVSLCVDPSDTVAGGGEPGPMADQHIDFGLALPCEEVAGVVFEDIDRDGCDNSGVGIEGVTVELFDCDAGGAAVATTVTGVNGEYTFGPDEVGSSMICLTPGGSYNVVISGLPTGYVNTPGLGLGCPGAQDNAPANDGVSLCVDPSDTVAGAGETIPGADQHIDFGLALPCEEVAGVVFEDIDRDGCDNSGVGVQGVTVELFDCDAGGAAVASTVTGVNGEYTFGPDEVGSSMVCLTPGGSYNVVISGLPGDYIYTPGPGLGCAGDTDDSPANDGVSLCVDPSDTVAGVGEPGPMADQHIDFGLALPCEEVAGVVFEDIDRDGCDNSGVGIEGVTVELFDCDAGGAAVATTVTGVNGEYTFGPDEVGSSMICLTPGGSYNVVISGLTGDYIYTPGLGLACAGDTDDSPANDGVSLCVDPSDTVAGVGEPGPMADQHIDFGLALPCEEIAGVVFNDVNEDGCKVGEVGVPDVIVRLFDCTTGSIIPVAAAITGPDGSYTFGPDETGDAEICLLPGGSYSVEINSLPGDFVFTSGLGMSCVGDEDDSPANDGVSVCVDPSDTVASPEESGPADDEHVDFGIVIPCAIADIGIIAEGSQDDCLPAGGSITRNAIATGQVVPAGNSLVYILVDMSGNVLQVASVPEFIISVEGDYTIHPVIYDPLECNVIAGGTVSDIVENCRCVTIDMAGAPIPVRECCLSNSGGLLNGAAADCTISAESVSLNVPAGSTVGYILTTGPQSIVIATSPVPSFDVSEDGVYTMHPIVYDPLTYSLSGIALFFDDIFSVNTTINTTGACANVDLVGLDIIADTCSNDCPVNLFIPGVGIPVTPDLYEVSNDIISNGLINSGPVEYSAGNSVELLPGFEVSLGTELHAYIEGCN